MAQLTLIASRKVPCPQCGAKANKPCVITATGAAMRTIVHIARKEAASGTKL